MDGKKNRLRETDRMKNEYQQNIEIIVKQWKYRNGISKRGKYRKQKKRRGKYTKQFIEDRNIQEVGKERKIQEVEEEGEIQAVEERKYRRIEEISEWKKTGNKGIEKEEVKKIKEVLIIKEE